MKLDVKKILKAYSENEIEQAYNKLSIIKEKLHKGRGEGAEFTGWLNLPSSINEQEIKEIEQTAQYFKQLDAVVIIGIGGSYLGAKAVITALQKPFTDKNKKPEILFAGNQLSADYHYDLLQYLNNKEYGIIVISKSGTTLEPALAFRLLREHLIKKTGKEKSRERIIAVTDKQKGALKTLADKENYKTFVIPDNIGGRFSVLTPVGLLPISIAGINIRDLLSGARQMQDSLAENIDIKEDIAANYALGRNLLYKEGKKIEILTNYNSSLKYFAEWWKQLFGESEGKENKGIFPVSTNFTTDLHSLGQYIQEGERLLFETVLTIENNENKLLIPQTTDNLDGLNYLYGKDVEYVNKQAMLGTKEAHEKGGVPNITLSINNLDAKNIGELIYFFEKSCAYSAYFIDVNPFNQPGVEAYKKNMYKLLGK